MAENMPKFTAQDTQAAFPASEPPSIRQSEAGSADKQNELTEAMPLIASIAACNSVLDVQPMLISTSFMPFPAQPSIAASLNPSSKATLDPHYRLVQNTWAVPAHLTQRMQEGQVHHALLGEAPLPPLPEAQLRDKKLEQQVKVCKAQHAAELARADRPMSAAEQAEARAKCLKWHELISERTSWPVDALPYDTTRRVPITDTCWVEALAVKGF